jgi:C4-dicarboxylate-specific signal transduction histidine kinase
VARPLREQFALATLLLLIPVSAVIVWAGRNTHYEQIWAVTHEADRAAGVIAAHFKTMPDAGPTDVGAFLKDISQSLPAGSGITITDSRGRIVASTLPRTDGIPVQEPLRGEVYVRERGWLVSVDIPAAVAWARTVPIYQRTVLITAIATLIMLVLEAVFARRWIRSLTHFQRSADRVGQGDLQTPIREPMPSLEFEHVRDAFTGMVDNLREAREALARQVDYERRMREELQSLQQQIIRQERLAAIGTLLSGIAHELNNPLQAISGLAEVVQRDRTLREDVRGDLALIQKESRRASAIVRNLSRFGRQQSLTPTAVILSDVIMSVVELRQRRLQELTIALDVEDRAVQSARAVFAELQQVLLNFVVNAEQAVATEASIERRITIRTMDLEGRVRVEVEDTGPGVPPEHEAKLFQPFFTTKPVGEGTGLGLSVSYGIMQSCGGSIGYHRRPGSGALFYFELPAEPEVAIKPARPALRAAAQ